MADGQNLLIKMFLTISDFIKGIDEAEGKVDELNAKKVDDKTMKVDANAEEANAEIDKLRAIILDKRFDIDANSGPAEAKLDFIKKTLSSIKETTADIKVNDPEAQAQVDSLKKKIDSMTYSALKIDLDDQFAAAKLQRLSADIDSLKRKMSTMDIGIEDGNAKMHIDAIKADLDTLHDKTVTVNVVANKNGLDAEIAKDSKPGGAISGGSFLGPAIALAAPLAAPIGADALGGIMALASAFTAASVGAAGFGAVAVPTISKVTSAVSNAQKAQQAYNQATTSAARKTALQQEAQAWQGLDAQQRQAGQSLISFESFFGNFAKSFQSPVLGIFTTGLKVLQTILTDIKPAIAGAAQAFTGLMNGLNQSLQTSDVKNFFSFVNSMAGEMITLFGNSLGNSLKGFMNLMVAFAPLGEEMAQGLQNMTQKFYDWTHSLLTSPQAAKGLVSFMNYFDQTGPVLISTIGNIVKSIINILVAMAPLGAAMLRVVQAMTQWIASFTKAHPAIVQLAAAVVAGVGAFKLLSPVLSPVISVLGKVPGVAKVASGAIKAFATGGLGAAIQFLTKTSAGFGIFVKVVTTSASLVGRALTFMMGPWGILIAAVAIGATLLITHWSQVSQWVQKNFGISIPQVLRTMGQFFTQIWDQIKNTVVAAWNYIEPTLMSGVRAVQSFWNQVWPEIMTIFTIVWDHIKPIIQIIFAIWQAEFQVFFGILRAIWGPSWALLGSALKLVWDEIVSAVRIAWDIISGVIKFGLDVLTGHWGAAWNDIKSIFSNVWNDIKGSFGTLIGDAFNFGANFVHMMASGISGAVGSVINAVSGVAGKIKSFLGFHSPTELGPGSEADVWAPNLMKMFISGINQYTPALQGALNKAIAAPKLAVSTNVAQMIGGSGAQGAGTSGASSQIVSSGSLIIQGPLVHVEHMDASNPGDIQNLQQRLYNAEAAARRAKGMKGV